MDISKLNKLSKLVTMETKRKPKIMLDPKRIGRIIASKNSQNIDINVNIDVDDWIITDEIKTFIENLNINENLSTEEKILAIYEKLCIDYVYDDNVLSYMKKYDEDEYGLPDFYGRDTNEEWKKNRANHNRRNCFEISRLLAKSINAILEESGKDDLYEVCILWDEARTHYFVGLASDEYCLTLDLDDFEEIKDLTRVKTDLTIKGIRVLQDSNGIFQAALDEFNSGRDDSSIEHIERIRNADSTNTGEEKSEELESINADDLQFLKNAIDILTKEYELDSAGLFEYMKEIVDIKIGPGSRRKVWTEVKTAPSGEGKVHTRCLTVEIGNQLYVIDVTQESTEKILHRINPGDISPDPDNGQYTKYQSKPWDDLYDGR